MEKSTNLLSSLYAQIYFPTYSNRLKDIASYLGYAWTYPGASGQYARVWRSQWELSGDPVIKDRLITYNVDDCKALEVVFRAIECICGPRVDSDETENTTLGPNVVRADELKREHPYGFRTNQFANPQLDYINKCAYWDYQRNKVYLRTNVSVKKAVLSLRRRNPKETAYSGPKNSDQTIS